MALEGGGAIDVGCAGLVELSASTLFGGTAADGAAASVAGGLLRLDAATTVTAAHVDPGGAWLAVRADCDATGTLVAEDLVIDPGGEALTVGGVPLTVPGPTFTCTADANGSADCEVP